jgi:hypothetical protein
MSRKIQNVLRNGYGLNNEDCCIENSMTIKFLCAMKYYIIMFEINYVLLLLLDWYFIK